MVSEESVALIMKIIMLLIQSFLVDETADSERGSNRDCFTKEAKIDNSKWSTFMAQIRETTKEKPVQQNIAAASKKKASKWSSFITEEEEDDDNDRNSEIEEKREDYLPMNEQERVEEDIHPDFL